MEKVRPSPPPPPASETPVVAAPAPAPAHEQPKTLQYAWKQGSSGTGWDESWLNSSKKWNITLWKNGVKIYNVSLTESQYWSLPGMPKYVVGGVTYTTNYDGKSYGPAGDSHSLCWYE